MRPELSPRVIAHLREAPANSAVARARAFGIDVAALAIRLATTTPLQRLAELDRRLHDVEAVRRIRP
jgi:hypothetical protein